MTPNITPRQATASPLWHRHWKLLFRCQIVLAILLVIEAVYGLIVVGPNVTVANFPLAMLVVFMAIQLRDNAKQKDIIFKHNQCASP